MADDNAKPEHLAWAFERLTTFIDASEAVRRPWRASPP